jgi:hypothetical protein
MGLSRALRDENGTSFVPFSSIALTTGERGLLSSVRCPRAPRPGGGA